MRAWPWLTLLSSACLLAVERPDFTGKWQLESNKSVVMEIDQSDGKFHVKTHGGPETKVDCDVGGQQCTGTVDGEPAKVSYWYNSSMLVEMSYRGKKNDRVVKVRRKISDDGKKMTVEVMPMSPVGKTEEMVFVKEEK